MFIPISSACPPPYTLHPYKPTPPSCNTIFSTPLAFTSTLASMIFIDCSSIDTAYARLILKTPILSPSRYTGILLSPIKRLPRDGLNAASLLSRKSSPRMAGVAPNSTTTNSWAINLSPISRSTCTWPYTFKPDPSASTNDCSMGFNRSALSFKNVS